MFINSFGKGHLVYHYHLVFINMNHSDKLEVALKRSMCILKVLIHLHMCMFVSSSSMALHRTYFSDAFKNY